MEAEKTEKNRSHLFQPGQSGNPNGRPKGTVSIVSALKRKLEEELPPELKKDPTEKRKYIDAMVAKVIEKSIIDGDVTMMRDLIDRIDGKPSQRIEGEMSIKNYVITEGDSEDKPMDSTQEPETVN